MLSASSLFRGGRQDRLCQSLNRNRLRIAGLRDSYLDSFYPRGVEYPHWRSWNENVARGPRVRLKIGNNLYDVGDLNGGEVSVRVVGPFTSYHNNLSDAFCVIGIIIPLN